MMNRLLATTALGALLLAVPAAAQYRTPMGGGSDSSSPSRSLSSADRSFLQEASAGGIAEVDVSTLAERQASSDSVKQFARRMIQDHSQANEQLQAIARQHQITLSQSGAAHHAGMKQRLQQLSGLDFDRTYIQHQVSDHQSALQLYQREASNGQNSELKSLASELQGTIAQHLQQAMTIQNQLVTTSENPESSSSSSPSSTTDPNPPSILPANPGEDQSHGMSIDRNHN
jgi:putative membrane protein